jgi:hypothetical protein
MLQAYVFTICTWKAIKMKFYVSQYFQCSYQYPHSPVSKYLWYEDPKILKGCFLVKYNWFYGGAKVYVSEFKWIDICT